MVEEVSADALSGGRGWWARVVGHLEEGSRTGGMSLDGIGLLRR